MIFVSEMLNEKYRTYVKTHERQIRAMEQKAKRILGRDYDPAYDFFCNVLESEEAYKILMSRRCLVIFQIFALIILTCEPQIQIHGTFITDKNLVKYKDKLSGEQVVIVDDILIHGRRVQDIYRMLVPQGLSDLIRIYVFRKSRTASCMDAEILAGVECEFPSYDWEWRELSCQLVNLIHASAFPYTSFVGAYVFDSDFRTPADNLMNRFQVIDNTNRFQRENNAGAYIFFDKEPAPEIFKDLAYDCCIRFYCSEPLGKTTCVPYVFLRDLPIGKMRSFLEQVCGRLDPDKFRLLSEDLKKDFDCKEGIDYQMRLLNALISVLYGQYVFRKYGMEFQQAYFDIDTLARSFSEEIAVEIASVSYEDARRFIDSEKTLKIPRAQSARYEDEELVGIWNDQRGRGMDFAALMPRYFYENGRVDEKRAKNGETRKQGLSLDFIFSCVPEERYHEISAAQLKTWDSGYASSCCLLSEDGTRVASYAAAGEQNFRYILEAFSKELQEMMRLYDLPLTSGSGEDGRELVKIYMDKLKLEPGDTRDKEVLKTFVYENIETLGFWKLPAAFQTAA